MIKTESQRIVPMKNPCQKPRHARCHRQRRAVCLRTDSIVCSSLMARPYNLAVYFSLRAKTHWHNWPYGSRWHSLDRSQFKMCQLSAEPSVRPHCRSYSPLPLRFKTVKPAFFASLIESGFSLTGELKVEMSFRTGRLQAGHLVSSGALTGRRSVNWPPQALHSPSHN